MGIQSISLSAMWEHFEHHEGSFYTTASSFGVLSDGLRTLIPDSNPTDVELVTRFLLHEGEVQTEVLADKLPVLISEGNVIFQYPYEGHFDWLEITEKASREQAKRPSIRRAHGRLLRYTTGDGSSLLSLEMPGVGPLERDPLKYVRPVLARSTVATPDDEVELFAFARPFYRGSRVRAELKRLLKTSDGESADEGPLLLHPGGLPSAFGVFASEDGFCGESLSGLGLDGTVPRRPELSLGPEALSSFAKDHDLPFVATNLSRKGQDEGRLFFPRFRLFHRGGLTIALLGIVGPDQLEGVPVAIRDQWTVEDPRLAIDATLTALEEQLHGSADLVIALVAADKGETGDRVMTSSGVDLVVGLERGFFSYEEVREVVEVLPIPGDPNGRRWRVPSLGVRAAKVSVGRVTAEFASTGPFGPLRLDRFTHESWPVRPEGDEDEAYRKLSRERAERDLRAGAALVLPDIDPLIRADKTLHPLVWGRVLLTGKLVDYAPANPVMFTDPLWMRFTTNALLDELDGDVALSRNLPRRGSIVGPIARNFIDVWTTAPDEVRIVTLSGVDLQGLIARMAVTGGEKPVFYAGMDPQTQMVRGRAIHPKHSYRVVVTDYVLGQPHLAPFFQGRPTVSAFSLGETSGRFVADEEGEGLQVSAVIQRLIQRWQMPDDGGFDPKHMDDLKRMFEDRSGEQEGRWTILVDELSLQGASYGNSPNVDTFAASKETRVTTPTHFSVGAKTDVVLQYDGPDVAWENRLKGQIQHQDFDIPGQDIPPQESADDVVLSSEVRLNAVKIDLGTSDVPLVPFLQAAYDTELTPTPNPTEDDPNATFPHQHIVRASLGQVLFPRTLFREVRLGVLTQYDLSELDDLRYDFGLLAGFKLSVPIVGSIALTSDLDFRYLFLDDNDTEADLGLVLSSVTRLVVPLTQRIQLFAFADLYFVKGKKPDNDDLGGSQMFGLGLNFSHFLSL